MSEPLKNPRHEAFALAVANGHKLQRAHELAEFKPDGKTAWTLRHRPDVSRRVEEILKHRVRSDTRTFVRRQKSNDDLLQRAFRGLEAIAFQDLREVANWRAEPQLNEAGEVTSFGKEPGPKPSPDCLSGSSDYCEVSGPIGKR